MARLSEIRTVLVVRALPGLGDMLCAIPAVRSLRRSLPNARITLLGLPWAASFAERFSHYFDDFLPLPGFPGLEEAGEDSLELERCLGEVRQRRFDLAVQLHGSGRVSNALTQLCGARSNAGYHPADSPPPAGLFFPYPESGSEIRRNLSLMEQLGGEAAGTDLEFPVTEVDLSELDMELQGETLVPGEYVCIHPGARLPARRWLPERFAAVGEALAAEGFRIVVTGSEAERVWNQRVCGAMRAPALNMARPMGAGALAALIRDARLLVCNDTGVSHIASALGVPSVVVFTAGDVERWAPLNAKRHRVIFSPVDCRPCNWVRCPIGHVCADRVGATAVIDQALELLGKGRRGRQELPSHVSNILVVPSEDESAQDRQPVIDLLMHSFPQSKVTTSEARELPAGHYDAAVILTPDGESPYESAYRCYLAGIPVRAGMSVEFGGALLTHWVRPLPAGVSRRDRYVYFAEVLSGGIAERPQQLREGTVRSDAA